MNRRKFLTKLFTALALVPLAKAIPGLPPAPHRRSKGYSKLTDILKKHQERVEAWRKKCDNVILEYKGIDDAWDMGLENKHSTFVFMDGRIVEVPCIGIVKNENPS